MTQRPSNKPDKPEDRKQGERDEMGSLPITGEVGSEGGSYADGAMQRATRSGDAPVVTGGDGGAPGAVSGAIAPSPDEAEDGVHHVRRGRTPGSSEKEDS